MKKLSLLIPVLFFVITAKAIAPGTKALYNAYNAADAGATIVLEAGTFDETDRIIFTKDITIMAAEGAEVIVKPHKDNQIKEGAKVKFKGIKFDGSEMGTYSYLIRSYDATAGKELRFDGCEMTGFAGQYLIFAEGASRTLDSVIINDCKCVGNGKDAVYIGAGSDTQETAKGIIVKNSTFANFAALAHSVIEVDNYNGTQTPNIEVTVDHCTFYNNPTSASGYADIRVHKSTKVAISNCIFAHPAAYSYCGTYCYGGTINNCLTYNYAGGTKGHRATDIDVSTCLPNADPLFTDAANGNFSYAGDYVNDNVSPARNAGTDGSDLGDPRWYTDAIYSTTDFAGGYTFAAAKANLSGNILYETGAPAPQNPYLRYYHATYPGEAKWVIKATRACYVSATINMADNTWNYDKDDSQRKYFQNHKHVFIVELRDAMNNLVDSVQEGEHNGDGSSDGWDTYPTVNLQGSIHIPEAGVYFINLKNNRKESRCGVESITLTYQGGAVQNITNEEDFETNINDAWYSPGGSRDDSKISLPESTMSTAWVRWNIHVETSDFYNIKINFEKGDADHTCGVKIYNAETTVFDKHESRSSAASPTELGRTFIPAGDYILEYTNDLNWSTAKLISIEIIPFAAPTTTIPETLDPNDAIYTSLVYVEGGELYFTPSNKTGYILDQWAQWKVRVTTAGTFLFTMNVTSTLEQIYKISILDSESNELYYYENNPGSGDKTIKHYFNLATGNYFIKVQNTQKWSDGHLVSLVVSQPSIVTLDEAAETDEVIMDNNRTTDPINVQIIRTITAGMYNTFCLPFDLTLKEFKGIFGEDAVLKEMESAELEGDFVLNLNFSDATSVYRCKPYLIKTSRNIVNPAFADVTIKADEDDKYVTTGTNADFISTLIATELEADPDNLFLAADNKIYFPQNNPMPIKGFRAYFHVHDVPAGVIKRARIVEQGNVVTEVDLVNGELQFTDKQARKTIEDGQLLIIRDGIRYNALGNKIK